MMINHAIKDKLLDCQRINTVVDDVPAILQKLNNSHIEIKDLVATVSRYPVILGRILAVTNSAWVSPRVPITSIKQACVMLGPSLIRSIGIGLIISSQFNSYQCKFFDVQRYWISAFLTAEAARMIAVKGYHLEMNISDEYFSIGLLHNLGVLALASIEPELTSETLKFAKNEDIGVNEAFIKMLGIGYLEAGAILLTCWGIPTVIIDAISNKDDIKQEDVTHQFSIVQSAKKVSKSLILASGSPEKMEEIPLLTDLEKEVFSLLQLKMNDVIELAGFLA